MNHTKSVFHAPGGPSFSYHSWEVRQGGFRRAAILLVDGFLPAESYGGLLDLLLGRYFKVYAAALPDMRSPKQKPMGLAEFSRGLAAFTRWAGEKDRGVPQLAIVSSMLCLPFLCAAAKDFPRLQGVALLSPLASFTLPPFAVPLFLRRWVKVRPPEDSLGTAEEVKEMGKLLAGELRVPKRLVKDVRRLSGPFKVPGGAEVAVFAGEGDPLLSANPAADLARSLGAELYSYPRGKHLLFWDKHSKNVLKDLGAFLDRAAARKASR